jgi:hypothetical protein
LSSHANSYNFSLRIAQSLETFAQLFKSSYLSEIGELFAHHGFLIRNLYLPPPNQKSLLTNQKSLLLNQKSLISNQKSFKGVGGPTLSSKTLP